MFGFSNPLRLLREKWPNATMLAEEIYAMAKSTEPVMRQGPVTIEVPQGQPGLTIRRTGPTSAAPNVTMSFGGLRSRPAPPTFSVQAERLAQAIEETRRPSPMVDVPGSRGASFGAIDQPGVTVPEVGAPDVAGQRPGVPTRPDGSVPGRRTRPGPDGVPGYAQPTPITAPQFQAYQAPLVSIEGPTAFKGPEPVQFQVPPLVWNPVASGFTPLAPPPSEPDDTPNTPTVFGGIVQDGTVVNNTVKVLLYRDGPHGTPDTDPVDLYIPQIDPNEVLPTGMFIDGIKVDADGVTYYAQIPVWQE